MIRHAAKSLLLFCFLIITFLVCSPELCLIMTDYQLWGQRLLNIPSVFSSDMQDQCPNQRKQKLTHLSDPPLALSSAGWAAALLWRSNLLASHHTLTLLGSFSDWLLSNVLWTKSRFNWAPETSFTAGPSWRRIAPVGVETKHSDDCAHWRGKGTRWNCPPVSHWWWETASIPETAMLISDAQFWQII